MRRTFRLKKQSIELKAGTIVQEACDDGDQVYKVLNLEKSFVFDDWNKYFSGPEQSFSRDSVEKNTEFFEEVFPATELYLTSDELSEFKQFIKNNKKVGK